MKSNYEERECVQVVWKDLKTRQRVVIGMLYKNENYIFIYNQEKLAHAKELGFKGLIAFPDFNKEYISKRLFPAFATRLPDRRRSDIQEILKEYGLEEYDAYELLKKTEGRLPTDTLEFIELLDLKYIENSGKIIKNFFVAGVRHSDVCYGKQELEDHCTIKIELEKGDQLSLKLDNNNLYDPYAVKIYKDTYHIGFVPIYYSKEISKALENKYRITCEVKEFNRDKPCQYCLIATIRIEK